MLELHRNTNAFRIRRVARRIVFRKLERARSSRGCGESQRGRERDEVRRHPVALRLRLRDCDFVAIGVQKPHGETGLEVPQATCRAFHRERAYDGLAGYRLRNGDRLMCRTAHGAFGEGGGRRRRCIAGIGWSGRIAGREGKCCEQDGREGKRRNVHHTFHTSDAR